MKKFLNWFLNYILGKAVDTELPSPKPRTQASQLSIKDEPDGTVTATITGLPKGTHWTTVLDTNSLDPFVDAEMYVLLQPLIDEQDLIVGDIVDYALPYSYNGFSGAIHRITRIVHDNLGWGCTTKGDNPLCKTDPVIVRKEHLRRLFRGVVC